MYIITDSIVAKQTGKRYTDHKVQNVTAVSFGLTVCAVREMMVSVVLLDSATNVKAASMAFNVAFLNGHLLNKPFFRSNTKGS